VPSGRLGASWLLLAIGGLWSAPALGSPGESHADSPSRIFPVRYGMVVLQHDIGSVRLSGSPTLAGEPNDRNDSYLAQNAIAVSSLPQWIRDIRLRPLVVLLPSGSICRTRVKGFAAYSWASPTDSWDELEPKIAARRIFESGTRFIAADIVANRCKEGVAAVTDVEVAKRFLPAVPASDVLRSAALSEVSHLPSYRAVQSSYASFKAARRDAPPKPPLPAEWIDLPGDTAYWTIATGSSPLLLIAHFQRMPGPGQLAPAPGTKSGFADFVGSLLAVWRISDPARPTLVSVILEDMPPLDYFAPHGGLVEAGGALPLILFSSNGTFGVLSFVDGRYRLDDRFGFGPKKPQK
jgi:hypothetical protein